MKPRFKYINEAMAMGGRMIVKRSANQPAMFIAILQFQHLPEVCSWERKSMDAAMLALDRELAMELVKNRGVK